MTPDDLDALACKWAVAMRSDGAAPNTIRTYTAQVRAFTRWQRAGNRTGFGRDIVREHVAALLDGDGARLTANTRVRGLRYFSAWLAGDAIIPADELTGLSAPKGGKRIVRKLGQAEVDAMLAACAAIVGAGARRDEALIRLLTDTGARSEEVLRMDLPGDLDRENCRARFRKTKGNKERWASYSPATAAAIGRYLDMRGGPDDGPLWLSQHGTRLSYQGMYVSLGRRAKAAGVKGCHPHRFRHTFAAWWLRDGGSEIGLQAMGGWDDPKTMARYVEDYQADLAHKEAEEIFARRGIA